MLWYWLFDGSFEQVYYVSLLNNLFNSIDKTHIHIEVYYNTIWNEFRESFVNGLITFVKVSSIKNDEAVWGLLHQGGKSIKEKCVRERPS